jgi:glycosyltransferase involved in cell wall biosynthesis
VLVLAPFPPRLDAVHGGGRAVARLLLLHAESSRVALLALRGPGEPGIDDAVASACELVELVEHVPVGRSLRVAWRERRRAGELLRGRPLWVVSATNRAYREELERLCADWRPDVVLAELGVMGGYLPVVSRPARRVLVDHDPGVRRANSRLSRRAWSRFAQTAAAAADAVVVFSDEDAAAMRPLVTSGTVLERIPLPWLAPPTALDPVGASPPTVLFVGNFRHAPNRVAARRLVRLLPDLRRRHTDVVLALVGEHPPADIRQEGVIVPGRVDDVTPWLAAAAVVAVPLEDGGGVRVKVAEALAAGKAVVGTPLAFEGLGVENGREALIEVEDSGLVEAISGLLEEPERRRALGAAARAWAERLPAPASIEASYEALYRRLGAR